MNKTDRKNKTNLTVTWPSHGTLFTIKELWASNPGFYEITLRVRIDKAIKKDRLVSVIGHKNVGKGRPTMILSMNPVSQELLDSAYASGIQPPEIKPLVTVASVTNTPPSDPQQEISLESTDSTESDVSISAARTVTA